MASLPVNDVADDFEAHGLFLLFGSLLSILVYSQFPFQCCIRIRHTSLRIKVAATFPLGRYDTSV